MKKKFAIASIVFSLILIALAFRPEHSSQTKDNTLTDEEKKNGWVLLFDGKSTNNWRTYKNLPNDSWEVVDGQLHAKKEGVQHRADLVTKSNYSGFEIQLDWKIDKGCNSGLLYHVLETQTSPYETGPEYQLIDDNVEKIEDWQKSGADYAMYPPSSLTAKPVGQYNHTRLVFNGTHVEHWLNGVKVVDFVAWSPDWQKKKMAGKWKDYPEYGKAKSGLIDLQDHGGGIWFKNIKIKKLN
jgi:3-keto-disaccharide hydrolase